ncbi:MAG: NERD domain-containing protein [Mogibacterium sp.]|nr:NERD domain-containing protein [Mogibacterium sp.]
MAKMIPSRIPSDTKSSAEKKLFYKLQDMEDTDDWTVLHSVGIANHPTQSQGEADFVVVIPNGGIFVLEVKGGRILYHHGKWESKDRNGDIHPVKDPVNEANEAMHAFADYIQKKIPPIESASHALFGFGTAFPDSEMHGAFSIPDLDDAQIADCNDLHDMKHYLLGLAKFWKSRKASVVEIPDASDCRKIVQLLRPEFDARVSLRHQIKSVERQSITLTENQQDIFEGLRDNERCLVRGGAGTGKTLIAINLARELAADGKKVAFFCYNRQLASYLEKNTTEDGLCCCGSLTDYMFETLQKNASADIGAIENKDQFCREILPNRFEECFIENELEQFDCLIIDEAQDLMTDPYLEVLDLILKDGLAEGSWYFFMDAERQNIFHSGLSYEVIKQMLKDRKVFYARFELKDNCRNSVSIIRELDDLFGTNTRYPDVEEKGAPVVKKLYKKDKDQAEKLTAIIRELLEDGIKPEMITIISPHRYENSVVSQLSPEIPLSVDHDPGKIFFSSIDSFKGLENSIIIIVDIFDFRAERDIARLYIGMTRARSALYILLSETANRNLGKLKGLQA